MVITLNADQERCLLQWARAITAAHRGADCLPPGYDLVIAFGPPFGVQAQAVFGSQTLDLGDVSVEFSS